MRKKLIEEATNLTTQIRPQEVSLFDHRMDDEADPFFGFTIDSPTTKRDSFQETNKELPQSSVLR
jgi:hypothetical protein